MMFSQAAILHAAAIPDAKTYAEFVAHIISLAASPTEDAVRHWGEHVPAQASVVQALSFEVGDMEGSSWGPLAGGWRNSTSNIACRIIQHAMPSPAAFADLKASGRRVFIKAVATAPGACPSVSRNGYTSIARSQTTTGRLIMTEFIRWDGVQAWKSDPSTGSAETPYDW